VLAVWLKSGDCVLDYLFRFFIGGIAVSLFAVLSDVFRPKSFAGLFGAAPSIALSTLGIAFYQQGAGYVAIEGRSMILGAIALCLYCVVVCYMLKRGNLRALPATTLGIVAWMAIAFGAKWALLGW